MFIDYPVSFPVTYLWPSSDAATWLGRSRLIKRCWPVMLPSTPGHIRSSPHPNFLLSHPSWIIDRRPFTTLSSRVRSLNPVSSGHLKAFLMGVWRGHAEWLQSLLSALTLAFPSDAPAATRSRSMSSLTLPMLPGLCQVLLCFRFVRNY